MTRELAAVAALCDVPEVKAVVLTGAGRFFCAGGDLKAMAASPLGAGPFVKGIADDLHRAISTFARMDAVLITAVNGVAAGAGFSLAVAGDLVLAADNASFTMAYTRAGLSPDGSSSYYLPRLVGVRRAQELMLTNRTLTAAEAADWGLINDGRARRRTRGQGAGAGRADGFCGKGFQRRGQEAAAGVVRLRARGADGTRGPADRGVRRQRRRPRGHRRVPEQAQAERSARSCAPRPGTPRSRPLRRIALRRGAIRHRHRRNA